VIDDSSDLADVCFEVCTALQKGGITAVLTGGSAATIYAPSVYQSGDADFIITMYGTGAATIVAALGYLEEGGTYRHATNPFTLEFPKGPLSIGDDLITSWATMQRGTMLLHILSRTDCVRDRLLWFFTDNDRSALAAAVGVAQSGEVDRDFIRQSGTNYGFSGECDEFFDRLK
jgi:hypothetical protein